MSRRGGLTWMPVSIPALAGTAWVISCVLSGCSEAPSRSTPPAPPGPLARPHIGAPGWSASGAYLGVIQYRSGTDDPDRLVIVSAAAKRPALEQTFEQPLTPHGWFPYWAPSGPDRVAYVLPEPRWRRELRITRGGWPWGGRLVIASPRGKVLQSYDFVGDFQGLCWSHDAARIALVLTDDGGTHLQTISTSGPLERLNRIPVPKSLSAFYADWQPEGRLLLSILRHHARSKLVAIDTLSGKTRTLVDEAAFPLRIAVGSWAWSPDGRQVHFAAHDQDGAVSLYTLSVTGDTKPVLRAKLAAERCRGPVRWSPDRKRIAFLAGGPTVGIAADLYLAHADGTAVERLTQTGDAAWFSFSPDGGKLAFGHGGPTPLPTSLSIIDLATKHITEIWRPGGTS